MLLFYGVNRHVKFEPAIVDWASSVSIAKLAVCNGLEAICR